MLTYTLNLIIGGAVGIMVVVRVCRPLNVLRGFLCAAVIFLFSAGVLLIPDFLGIRSIFCWQMVLAVPLVCMVILLYNQLVRLILFFYRLRDMVQERIAGLFPHRLEGRKS